MIETWIDACVRCELRRVENKDNGLCATCGLELRKQERTQAKVVKPIKKVSDKRNKQNQEYARLRDEYLKLYPACEVRECNNRSNQIHHVMGREGEKLTNPSYFLAICPDCHTKIHANPKWAQDEGYMILRSI